MLFSIRGALETAVVMLIGAGFGFLVGSVLKLIGLL